MASAPSTTLLTKLAEAGVELILVGGLAAVAQKPFDPIALRATPPSTSVLESCGQRSAGRELRLRSRDRFEAVRIRHIAQSRPVPGR